MCPQSLVFHEGTMLAIFKRQTNNVGAIKNETLGDWIKCMQSDIYTTEAGNTIGKLCAGQVTKTIVL